MSFMVTRTGLHMCLGLMTGSFTHFRRMKSEVMFQECTYQRWKRWDGETKRQGTEDANELSSCLFGTSPRRRREGWCKSRLASGGLNLTSLCCSSSRVGRSHSDCRQKEDEIVLSKANDTVEVVLSLSDPDEFR